MDDLGMSSRPDRPSMGATPPALTKRPSSGDQPSRLSRNSAKMQADAMHLNSEMSESESVDLLSNVQYESKWFRGAIHQHHQRAISCVSCSPF